MSKDIGTIRFELNKSVFNSKGQCYLRLSYSLNNERSYFNTGISLYPEQWQGNKIVRPDAKAVKLYKIKQIDIPLQKNINDLNDKLSALISTIREIEKELHKKGIVFTKAMVIAELKDKTKTTYKDAPGHNPTGFKDVPSFIYQFAQDNYKRKDINLVKEYRTIQVYKNIAKDLESMKIKKRIAPLFTNMTVDFMKEFANYCIETLGNGNITTSKKISTLKTILTYAQRKEYGYNIQNIPPEYKEYSITRDDSKLEVVALTLKEIELLKKIELKNPHHDRSRNILLFSCHTGLRVSDLEDLNKSHIANGAIMKNAVKTKERLHIPLSNLAKEILAKYDNDPQRMMTLHRNKINIYLKKIGELAQINAPIEKKRRKGVKTETVVQPKYERLSLHVGRKTFVTTLLAKNVGSASVMALSGHRSVKAFQRYIDVADAQRKEAIGTLD